MKPFQLFNKAASQFWSTADMAGPTSWDVLRFWDHPRPLRQEPRKRPASLGIFHQPELLTDAAALTTFWRNHYRGEDWVFAPEPEWIAGILAAPTTLALGVREEGQIVGSIVCRAVGGDGPFRLGTLELPTAFVIEGLCIHPRWRGHHVAGWLIAWVDHLANQGGPQAFFWSREAPPRDITYVATHTYGYLPLSALVSDRSDEIRLPEAVPWDAFRRLWASYVPRWDILGEATFPTSLPTDPLRVWRQGANYVVVSDTRRRTLTGGRIWEVQFCGDLYAPTEGFIRREGEGRRMLEAVGALLAAEGGEERDRGLLFVSSAPWQGGCVTTWPRPWIVGTAGVHTTYIYNYMPPVFHRLATLFLRNEL